MAVYLRNLANRVGEYFYVAYFIFLNITYIEVFHKSHKSTGLSWALGVFCPKNRKKHVFSVFSPLKNCLAVFYFQNTQLSLLYQSNVSVITIWPKCIQLLTFCFAVFLWLQHIAIVTNKEKNLWK